MGVLTAYLAEFLLPTSDNFVLSLDLSDNRLTDHSVEELMDWLASCEERVMVATLKLYKNQWETRLEGHLDSRIERLNGWDGSLSSSMRSACASSTCHTTNCLG
ncbi:MAG: uncharacterized protein KVP18_001658 [Porospora cf. gigantea A]|uniref:uncharacterized protein n=1 Tax=Porospora cf. gigantea A TaxID=2853593 RepID=UPI0035597325|nr:MAG: hypothetical protein KVP18_001658 [Porospora cf. gigantea A]